MDELKNLEAKRDTLEARYDLIPAEALELMAKRFHLGALKYGDNNWKDGQPNGKSPINHALMHLVYYQYYRQHPEEAHGFHDEFPGYEDTPANHLAAALVNISMEVYFREHPEIYDNQNRVLDAQSKWKLAPEYSIPPPVIGAYKPAMNTTPTPEEIELELARQRQNMYFTAPQQTTEEVAPPKQQTDNLLAKLRKLLNTD